MLEKDFESILCKYPELIENNLSLKGRQVRVYGKIIDILFEDKFNQKLIVELKAGPIDRKHIGQVMEYEGGVLSIEDPTARIMLIGNRVPPNLKKALDHHGVEWKEISLSQLREFMVNKNDSEFLSLFDELQKEPIVRTEKKMKNLPTKTEISKELSGVWIFQSNPKNFKMLEKLRHGNDMDTWRVMRFRKEIKRGDTVLVWIAGSDSGIYALGEVVSDPEEIPLDKETLLYSTEQGRRILQQKSYIRVWVKYKNKFIDNPIMREYIKNNPALKNLSIMKQPQGTNFKVSIAEWEELKKILPVR